MINVFSVELALQLKTVEHLKQKLGYYTLAMLKN